MERKKQFVGWIKGMFGPRAAILLYHRVTESDSDPCLLNVKPKHFEEHLQVIREIGYPLRLEDLVCSIRDGKMADRAVCLTFDDGYRDNLYTVKPILERYDLQASVFVTTGTSGRMREFWWDELDRIFLQPGCLPDDLQLNVDGKQFHWDLGNYANYDEADFLLHKDWTLMESSEPTPRHTAYRAVHQLLMLMDSSQQRHVLDSLLSWSGVEATVRLMYRVLEPNEVVELEQDKIVKVGAHTVNHLDLSKQPAEVQYGEICQSKSMLEDWLGHEVTSFAYPYGFYSKRSIAAVRAAGFAYGCGGLSAVVRGKNDPLLLPRLEALDWDGDAFGKYLTRWLGR